MKVIVGLGNPGSRYRATRHNVGFEVIDYLAQAPTATDFRTRFHAQVAALDEEGRSMLLVKPETFMNLSGRSVREVVDFFKLPLADLLVVCDDINLPLGKLRARARGTHGGHNGLRSIQELIGSTEYSRLRIGVGEPDRSHEDAAVDYVLGRFQTGERGTIAQAIQKAAFAALLWAKEGIDVCMNRVNAGEPNSKKDPPAGAL